MRPPSTSDGEALPGYRDGLYFTDFVPPPISGLVGGEPVRVRIWPPDLIPMHPRARRLVAGRLAGFWVVVEDP